MFDIKDNQTLPLEAATIYSLLIQLTKTSTEKQNSPVNQPPYWISIGPPKSQKISCGSTIFKKVTKPHHFLSNG
jgi:hypothetical protein